ncbi:MAG: hypothetical protein M3033_07265 [Acidobacteriota bacterium]|nr:hypothetical protein [Acidobacteriota bacterium]
MKHLFYSLACMILFSVAAFPQKGIDTQTQKIKEDSNRTTGTTRPNDAGGYLKSWGKDKTKVRARLMNPYKLNSRRDVLMETISEILKERKIIVDEAASRIKDGIIITQPFVFAKGAVTASNELNRYAVMPNSDASWTRGRYTLTIEVQSIDGVQNNVSVTAKVEGRSENGLQSEWTTLQSSGAAEDEFLSKLVEMVTGTSPDDQPGTDH